MKCRSSLPVVLSTLLLLCVSSARADESAQTGASSETSQWGLGIGVGIQRKPYRGIGNKTDGLPLLFFENKWVRVFGPGVIRTHDAGQSSSYF